MSSEATQGQNQRYWSAY